MGERNLELVALTHLGLGAAVPRDLAEGDLLEQLVARGHLSGAEAESVRAYLARNLALCTCGQRSVAPPETRAFECFACGASLVKRTSGGAWQAAPRAAVGVGSRIGPLELVAEIGRGASGSVFRARHEKLGRLVAVKVIQAAALDERRRKRFEREVRALAQLDHASIVKVHATYESGGALACEMDLVVGESLDARTARGGPFSWRDAAALVAKLARATEHAHRLGIVHRDLKPANVIVREADGEPLLIDFGLSRFTDQASSLTAAGTLMGTPVYMAPEAFGGETGVPVDIYGLGTILYQALTGRAPFQEATLVALFHNITHGECEPITGVPAALEAVRARAMAPDPLARHATAEALALDLERVLRGESVSRRRSPRALLVLLAAIAVALVSLALSLRKSVVPLARVSPVAEGLAAFTGPADAPRRAAALATLLQASQKRQPGHEELVAALDSAVALAPASSELRRVRARLARESGAALRAEDLAALASAPDAARDLEALATHALTVGVVGSDAASATHQVWLAHKDERAIALLFVLTACSRGDASLRGDVVLASQSVGSHDERARLLARALGDTDRLAALIEKEGFASTEAAGLARHLKGALTQLSHDPGVGDPELILLPIVAPLRAAWGSAPIADQIRLPVGAEIVGLLDVVHEKLSPRLLLLDEVLRVVAPDQTEHMRASNERLDAAGIALLGADPVFAAAALHAAALRATSGLEIDEATTTGTLDHLARALEGLAALPPWGEDSNRADSFWFGTLVRQCAGRRAFLLERRAAVAKDPAARRRDLDGALVERRRALDYSTARHFLATVRDKDVRRVVRLLLDLDRAAEADGLIEDLPERDGVRAELVRRGGDPRRALEIASKGARCSETFAACALAEADLGRLDDARRDLAELTRLEAKEPSFLAGLRAEFVAKYLAGKSR
jgi:serine/threonine-protein kinase